MTWIKSHDTLADHPKVLDLADRLGASENECLGILHRLWWWAIDNVGADGNLERYRPAVIERVCRFSGERGTLVPALQAVGFLDDLRLHDWGEYAGRLYAQREANRQRMRTAYTQSARRKREDSEPVTHRDDTAYTPSAKPEESRGEKKRVEKIQRERNVEGDVQPARPSKPTRKKSGKPRDPLLDHPAVTAWRDAFHLTPNSPQRQAIASTVTDLDHWTKVLASWGTRGYKPGNVAGQLEVYRDGWKGNGSGPRTPTAYRNPDPSEYDEPFIEERKHD